MSKKCSFLATLLIVISFSYAHAAGSSSSIGTVNARGDVRVDGSTIWGNATLFDGTAVQTEDANATLRLDNGAEVTLSINSRGVVYHDHLLLLQGKGQFKASRASFHLEADGLCVAPDGSDALGFVSLGPANTVDVAAVSGNLNVIDDTGNTVASLSKGVAISLHPAAAAGAPKLGNFSEVGLVTTESSHYYLTSASGAKYQLVNWPVSKLQKFVGDKVEVSGVLESAPTSGGIPQILLTSIQLNGGMTSAAKIGWIAGGIGGAAVAIGVYEGTKSSASK